MDSIEKILQGRAVGGIADGSVKAYAGAHAKRPAAAAAGKIPYIYGGISLRMQDCLQSLKGIMGQGKPPHKIIAGS